MFYQFHGSTEDEYKKNCAVTKQKLLERKYNKKNMNISMEKVDLIERKVLLQNNEKVSARKTYHQC